jgi:hypothetical protein
MARRPALRNTTTLLLEPVSSRYHQPPVVNFETNMAYQNSLSLHLDGPGCPLPGRAAISGSAAATIRNAVIMRVIIAIVVWIGKFSTM